MWVGDMGAWFENESSHDIPYIRADLAYELASLLKEWLENEDDDKDWIDYEDRVTAALKAMGEE
jgi:hypothetical protein